MPTEDDLAAVVDIVAAARQAIAAARGASVCADRGTAGGWVKGFAWPPGGAA
jgi:hypothetical protein